MSTDQRHFTELLAARQVLGVGITKPPATRIRALGYNLIVGRKFKLQANDIVFVPPAEIVKWNRTISLLLPQTDLFKSYNPIINNGLQTYKETP